jgi:hypothetical protein
MTQETNNLAADLWTLADSPKAANFARIVFDLLVQGQAGGR